MTDYTPADLDLVFAWLRARTLDIRDAKPLPLFIATAKIRRYAIATGRDFGAWPNQRAVKALLTQAGYRSTSVRGPSGLRHAFHGIDALPDDAPDIAD
ncbi:hypothetical protein ACFWVP_17550 [Streptomyces sp. NPDC058637]|uniref:hypothetical protein n=1 Tax=Streptomyces sp. NPDC058637 TaxID=3346569 RepID=UPI00365F288A